MCQPEVYWLLNNACYCSVAGKFEYQKKYDVNVCKQETSLLFTLDELEFHGKNERASINDERVGPEEGEGNSASQEEIETFIQEQKSVKTDVCRLILENIDEIFLVKL